MRNAGLKVFVKQCIRIYSNNKEAVQPYTGEGPYLHLSNTFLNEDILRDFTVKY